MNNTELIQLADDAKSNSTDVRLLARCQEIPSLSYLVIQDNSKRYFAQTLSPQLNINPSAEAPTDAQSLQCMIKTLDGDYALDSHLSQLGCYRAQVLGVIGENGLQSALTRPLAGSRARVADAHTVHDALDMRGTHPIGVLDNPGTPIPVTLDDWQLDHHIGVAGSTGSGKTQSCGRLLKVSNDLGRANIIYDLKPDYQSVDEASSLAVADPSGLAHVSFYSLGEGGRGSPIYIPAGQLDPSLLAWAIFHRNGEERQAEIAEFVLLDFANSRPDPNWHIEDFMDWILPEAPAMEARLTIRVNINPRTWEAVHRKLHMPGRIFDWIRNPATRRRGPLAGARPAAITRDPLDDLRAGGNVVIRIADADPRSYALFLDNFLRRQAELRLRAACSPKLLNLVDEAADIFCHPNRDFRSRAVSSLNEHIRKGRSRGIAFVVSVQNAGDIPQEIRHNLNSFMAGRHKHPKVLKEALPTVRFDVENEAQTLRPGEMLLDLFGVPSLMRSRMLLSPCRLS